MTGKENWVFTLSTKLIAGVNAIEQAGEELKSLHLKNILIVTDEAMMRTAIVERAVGSLKAAGIESVIFPQVKPDPTVECAEDAFAVLAGNNCDAVLGVGGGSAMDTAKAAAILAANVGPISQYEGANKIPNKPLPIFAVPTTAGTGSEVSQSSILADGNVKRSIRSVWAAPQIAFLDPTAIATVPMKAAVSSGLDALAHNLEAYVSRWASPMTDCLSEQGLRLVGESFLEYAANPENLEAGGKMQLAATLGAASFANARVGIPHALGMALGGVAHLPHGLACGLALPVSIEYSWMGNPKKYKRAAELLGLRVGSCSDGEAARALADYIVGLERQLGVSPALEDHGVEKEQVDALAAELIRSGLQATDPRNITLQDAKALVTRALSYQNASSIF